jgi:hypothetical protein
MRRLSDIDEFAANDFSSNLHCFNSSDWFVFDSLNGRAPHQLLEHAFETANSQLNVDRLLDCEGQSTIVFPTDISCQWSFSYLAFLTDRFELEQFFSFLKCMPRLLVKWLAKNFPLFCDSP